MVHIKSWRIALPSLRDALPMSLETGAQILRLRMTRGVARRHGDVDRRQVMLVQAKGFPGKALDAIARHGAPEGARCNRQAQSRMTFIVGQNRQAKEGVGQSSAALPYGAKLSRLMQTLARLEIQPIEWLWDCKKVRRNQGQRSFRPFARRRASNRRPLLVAMRARKPCVRARCKLLGLKVRFIAQLQET
jgi:hypothetical protein